MDVSSSWTFRPQKEPGCALFRSRFEVTLNLTAIAGQEQAYQKRLVISYHPLFYLLPKILIIRRFRWNENIFILFTPYFGSGGELL